LIGHSPVGSSYIYPEGEFLCIVSKQYDRGLQEDNNNSVSERVKVGNNSKRQIPNLFFILDFTRARLKNVI
jgi:hypothetical protein